MATFWKRNLCLLRLSALVIALVWALLAQTAQAGDSTTYDCGGEGERPCNVRTDFFWENGNLFCDRGLEATGFRVLPNVRFNGGDWANLNRLDITGLLTLYNTDLPAFRQRLNRLSQNDFLSNTCFGITQGGQCWTTPPAPAVVTAGLQIGNLCFPTGQLQRCTIDFLFGRVDGFRAPNSGACFPTGVLSTCTATVTPAIPGIPGLTAPFPDFNKPGWTVPVEAANLLGRLSSVVNSLPAVIQGIPAPPQVNFANYRNMTFDSFNPTRFTTDLNSLRNLFFNSLFLNVLQDLVADFENPPGMCVNVERRQGQVSSFQSSWEHWALRNQHALAQNEPLNWVQQIGTHNAYNNSADGYPAPNQKFSLTDQLNLGSRGLALDIHWFNDHLRLCHGLENHAGCTPTDRFYANGIKEIAAWLRANPEEVIAIGFEDRAEGHDNYVNEPIARYVGDLVFTPADGAALGLGNPIRQPWPSLQTLRSLGKRVIFTTDNLANTHGGQWIWAASGNPFYAAQAKNFAYTTGDYTPNNQPPPPYAGNPPPGCWAFLPNPQGEAEYWNFRFPGGDGAANLSAGIYEARSLLDPIDFAGLLDEEAVARAATCQLSISLDQLHAKEETPPANCTIAGNPASCRTPDRRLAAAVWSWQEGDRGDQGDAALFNGVDGRWRSRDPNEQHPFACGRPRSGDPNDWPDQGGTDWVVTTQRGRWFDGGRICQGEYGTQGYIFSAPVNGWQNIHLRGINRNGLDLWLNYNDIVTEGDWTTGGAPDDQAPSNRPPVAVTDILSTTMATPALIDVLANDSDPDGDPLTVRETTAPANGIVTLDNANRITYTPNPGFLGEERFTYTVSDGDLTAVATVRVTVVEPPAPPRVNNPPLAVDDSARTNRNQPVTIDVLGNDSDPDGDPLFVVDVTTPQQGAVTINADNRLTYTPNPDFEGADRLRYTISDLVTVAEAEVIIEVVGSVNTPPVAVDDVCGGHRGETIRGNVLENDQDAEGAPVTVTLVAGPDNGSLVLNNDGSFAYTPTVGFRGADRFTYVVSDGEHLSGVATVTLTVGD